MTPAARYAAAIEVLDRWRDGMPVAQALKAWARGARYAGSKDRAAVQDHVYDVLRQKGRAEILGGGRTGRALVLGLLRAEGVDPDTVFSGEGHAPTALGPGERLIDVPVPGPEVDVPDWLRPKIAAQFPVDHVPLYQRFQHRAPIYLRVNARKSDPDRALAALAADAITARCDPLLPTALEVVDGGRKLRQAAAYRDGRVEVQDLSVQRAVAGVDWPKTGRILDLCAGAGGKSLAIAGYSDAALFAHDLNPRRMADLPERATRAGVRITQIATQDLGAAGPFDAVVCDVPCSGSGTWRRDPEAKWRLTPERLADLCKTQAEILDHAERLVAPKGLLVYMTCSIFSEENDAQLTRFCDIHPAWRVMQRNLDTPMTASDGFFSAVLQRAP